MTTTLVRIPQRFLDDHAERDLDTPRIVRASKTHYWVERDDPAVPELLDDARYYAASSGRMVSHVFGLCASARATIKAFERMYA